MLILLSSTLIFYLSFQLHLMRFKKLRSLGVKHEVKSFIVEQQHKALTRKPSTPSKFFGEHKKRNHGKK
jgi:hypothetical protein